MNTTTRVADTYEYKVCQNCQCAIAYDLDSVDWVNERTEQWIIQHPSSQYTLNNDDADTENWTENAPHFDKCDVCEEWAAVYDCTLTEWA